MSLSRHAYAIVGLITVLSAISLSSSHVRGANSPSQNVVVTNTSSNPVPTLAQGTTQISGTVGVNSLPAVQFASGQNVGISGEPTVHLDSADTAKVSVQGTAQVGGTVGVSSLPAVQFASGQNVGISGEPTFHLDSADTTKVSVQGTPSVNVSSLPSLIIDNGTDQPIPTAPQGTTTVSGTVGLAAGTTVAVNSLPNVTLSNNANNPLPVQMVDTPGFPQDFSYTDTLIGNQTNYTLNVYTVGNQQQFTLQDISVRISAPSGEHDVVTINRPNGPTQFWLNVPMQAQGTFGNVDESVGALTGGHWFFQQNSGITVTIHRSSTSGSPIVYIELSGSLRILP